MKTFAIGDIHGNHKALLQVLELSKFDYDKDRLIVLGDVCDGWPFVRDCFDELLKIKNLIYILGNHDEWAMEWYDREGMYKNNPHCKPDRLWTTQGGEATLKSYGMTGYDLEDLKEMPEAHLNLLRTAKLYHVEGNDIFVHAGIMENWPVESTNRDVFLWDRDLIYRAWGVHHYNPKFKIQHYDNIFLGHTTTQALFKVDGKKKYTPEELAELGTKPLFMCNVVALDTGAGWNGKLTIMNVETKEYWQSDLAKKLYPDVKGRF